MAVTYSQQYVAVLTGLIEMRFEFDSAFFEYVGIYLYIYIFSVSQVIQQIMITEKSGSVELECAYENDCS